MKNIFLGTVLICVALISCSNNENVTEQDSNEIPKLEISSLKEAPLIFGAAIDINQLRTEEKYGLTLKTEFSSISPENAMKMDVISTGNGTYKFEDADEIVKFAHDNNMRVHGHTLIWHRSVPNWVNKFVGTKEEWKELMRKYITDVVSHYKGKLASWDVVNEAVTDEGQLRENIWLNNIGEEYIELAFRYAHEADPDAVLFYNDYGQEYSTAKIQRMVELLKSLKEKNVPVHGVGFQYHINLNTNERIVEYGLRAISSLNLKIHISELDIAVNQEKKEDFVFSEEIQEKQRVKYRNIVKTYMQIVPKDLQYGITTWGIYDGDSWLIEQNGSDYPLLFDVNYNKKLAYQGVLEGLYDESAAK